MIDLHAHVLPGMDDGAATPKEAVAMCHQAYEQGIRTIVATPHFSSVDATTIQKKVSGLNELLSLAKLDLTVLPGAEIPFSLELFEKQSQLPTINSSRYLLIELPKLEVPAYTEDVLFELRLAGYIPVLAHPERNRAVIKNPELLYSLIRLGCLVQVTAASLVGAWGKTIQQLAVKMLRKHWIHIIASDMHRLQGKRMCFSKAVAYAAKHVDEECFNNITQHWPAAIIQDRNVELPEPQSWGEKLTLFRGLKRFLARTT